MKIKKLSIEKLWDKYTFSVDFDEQITILIGKNGSGKSTVLNIINLLLLNNISEKNPYEFKTLSISLDKGFISFKNGDTDFNKEIQKLDIFNEKILENFLKRLEKELTNKVNTKSYIDKNDTKTLGEINHIFISTFDMEVKNKTLIQKHYDDIYIKTELDLLLNDLITKFKLYQLKLTKQVKKIQKKFDTEVESFTSNRELKRLKNELLKKNRLIGKIYEDKDFFQDKLNELFSDTKKSITLDENNSIVFNIDDKTQLTPYQLSSGEKQILIILLSVILQENQSTIMLMDEPEISLHVEWQRVFIKTLLALNSNLQLIIATHSPAIVSKGYRDKVVTLNNFRVVSE